MIEYVSKLDPDDRGRTLVGSENKGEAEPTRPSKRQALGGQWRNKLRHNITADQIQDV